MKAGQTIVSASLEDYLEAIHHIVASNGAARAKDIATAMKVKNASVTQALRSLAEKKLVNYAPYEVITLTPQGQLIANDVIQRHEVLEKFLSQVLGLPHEVADENACLMEHSISRPILNRLIQFVEYFKTCPMSDIHWDEEEGFFCGAGSSSEEECNSTNSEINPVDNCGRDICNHKASQFNAAAESGHKE